VQPAPSWLFGAIAVALPLPCLRCQAAPDPVKEATPEVSFSLISILAFTSAENSAAETRLLKILLRSTHFRPKQSFLLLSQPYCPHASNGECSPGRTPPFWFCSRNATLRCSRTYSRPACLHVVPERYAVFNQVIFGFPCGHAKAFGRSRVQYVLDRQDLDSFRACGCHRASLGRRPAPHPEYCSCSIQNLFTIAQLKES